MRVSQRSPSTEFSHWASDRLKAYSRNCFMPAASSLIFGRRHGIELRVFRAFDFHGLRQIAMNEFMVANKRGRFCSGSLAVFRPTPHRNCSVRFSFRWDLLTKP